MAGHGRTHAGGDQRRFSLRCDTTGGLAEVHPAYFGAVMATGIVSIATEGSRLDVVVSGRTIEQAALEGFDHVLDTNSLRALEIGCRARDAQYFRERSGRDSEAADRIFEHALTRGVELDDARELDARERGVVGRFQRQRGGAIPLPLASAEHALPHGR
jgi:hypothetical protein